jgi:hypothetical protein
MLLSAEAWKSIQDKYEERHESACRSHYKRPVNNWDIEVLGWSQISESSRWVLAQSEIQLSVKKGEVDMRSNQHPYYKEPVCQPALKVFLENLPVINFFKVGHGEKVMIRAS